MLKSKPSRRDLFGAAAVLPALSAAPAACAAPASAQNPDARLIALCRELLDNQAEAERLDAPFYEVVGGCKDPEVNARREALSDRYHELTWEIAETPARTPEGWRAKARACLTKISLDRDGEAYDADEVMAWSLFNDLLRDGGPA